MDQKLQASNRPCSNNGESALSGQLRFGGSSRRAHLRMQRAMEADNFNFCITDEGKAPTRKGILFVVSFMYDPLGSLRLSFCQPRA